MLCDNLYILFENLKMVFGLRKMSSMQDAQKEKKYSKGWHKTEKVIHIKKSVKFEKNELYTKLSTLSTFKKVQKVVYIVKKTNIRFVKK